MPNARKAHLGAPIAFETIPLPLRPGAVAAYLELLDDGYDPARISFLDYGEFIRVEGRTREDRPGTSRPVSRDDVGRARAERTSEPTREEDKERRSERESDLRALLGQRVRIRWPNGHQQRGVVRERKLLSYRHPRIVLEDVNALRALEDATSLEVLDRCAFKPADTASDWTAR